jgi:glycosyltransferase involved in cell wall biosynthesis
LYFRAIPEALKITDRLQQRFFIWPIMLRFQSRIACVSQNTQYDIERFYPKQAWKAAVTGSGSPRNSLLPERHPILNGLRRPFLLYVGNVLSNKNVDTLTKAADMLAERGVQLATVHVGLDEQGLMQQAASRLKFADPPIRLTSISDAQLLGLYTSALCFVNTSLYEGFCLPILEAQKAGTPVVCSRMPAVGETAGIGALQFDPRNPAELAAHIQQLISDPGLRRQLQEMGRQNASNYCWLDVAARFENMFDELLATQ